MGDLDKLFSVVHFKSDDAVETVPNSWIFGEDRVTYCRFPPSKIIPPKPKHPRENDRKPNKQSPVQITCPPIGLESLDQYLPHNGTVTLPLLNPIPASAQFEEPDTLQDDINEPGMSRSESFAEEVQTGPCVDGKRDTVAAKADLQTYMGEQTRLHCRLCRQNKEDETVLKLVTLESGINEIKLLLLKLLANQQTRETTTDSDSYPLLPLTSREDLDTIENWLSQTKHEEKLANALSKIGGQKISSSVYNILSHVISPSFAKEIRLTSASGKLAIGPTKPANVIRESVRVSSSESVSNRIIDQYIGRWFRNSNDRKGGRKLRKKRKMETPTNNEDGDYSETYTQRSIEFVAAILEHRSSKKFYIANADIHFLIEQKSSEIELECPIAEVLSTDSVCKPSKIQQLAKFAVQHNITHAAMKDLLGLVREWLPHHDFPKDPRSLSQTPRNLKLIPVQNGKLYHFGLTDRLRKAISKGLKPIKLPNLESFSNLPNLVTIKIGIDGLPLSKSSYTQFWPILASIDQEQDSSPFIVTLYEGEKKPASINEFLEPFVTELKSLETSGITYNDV
ncbi:hypothetical protein Ocin01_12112, partial [Orchesella cincta]